jgi:muramoyltetrapeptide carboxypeptidase LdcA involved in peptidoglycan recycling
MELIRPARLQRGDTLAAVTLSWGGPAVLPHRYETGKRQLEETFGVTVVEMPHTLASPEELDARPDLRAADLMAAFADPSIAGIVSTIGGDDSIRVLPHLDLGVIAANPKVFVGFSDTTVTHMACLRAGLGTFYGPSIMAGFAENGGVPGYLAVGVRRMLFGEGAGEVWPPNEAGWTVERLDWADPVNQSIRRRLQPSAGWRWLQGASTVEGPLVVGCLEVLDWLRGTEWWPDLDGAVLASSVAPPVMTPRVGGAAGRTADRRPLPPGSSSAVDPRPGPTCPPS